MELIIFIAAYVLYRCILRDEKRMNEEMRENPPVKYIVEIIPKKPA